MAIQEKENTFVEEIKPMSKTSKPTNARVKKTQVLKKEKPVILITNDDGVSAPGIRNLVEAVKDLGKIVVVAPDKPQS